MSVKKQRGFQITQADISPGPGIFASQQQRNSTIEAYRAMLKFIIEENNNIRFSVLLSAKSALKTAAYDASMSYWRAREIDYSVKRSEIKNEFLTIQKPLAALLDTLSNISPAARHVANLENARKLNSIQGNWPDLIAEANRVNSQLAQAIESISKAKNTKSAAIRHSACARILWTLREQIAERQFERNYEIAKLKDKNGLLDGFVNRDPQFVYVVMRAIDPRISPSDARSALRVVAKANPKTG